jgi:1-acyl-sn-glycerol-3-phosphate acyltransferase
MAEAGRVAGRARAFARLGAFAGATGVATGVLAVRASRGRPPLSGTARVAQRWGSTLVTLLGIDIEREGDIPAPGAILVANHRSYLDIPVLLSLLPCIFVAKQEVAGWPVLGRAASLSETVFVRRQDGNSGARALRAVGRVLRQRQTVTLFPEGTTFGGPGVLPFEPGGFRLAAAMRVPVVPVAIEYARPEDAWTDPDDGTFLAHFLECLSQRSVRVRVVFGPPAASREPEAMRAEVQRWIEEHLRRPGSRPAAPERAA